MKSKTQAALCKALLEGLVLNVRNCPRIVGYSNIGREMTRMIEKPFGVEVSRTDMHGKNRYGQHVDWVNYFLHKVPRNKEGIKKMEAYVEKYFPSTSKRSNKPS